MVEIYNDTSLALPPLNSTLAHLMMKKTTIYKALKGVRGRSSVDINALEKLIVNFSHLVMEKWRCISEIEINPLLASHGALVALDARIILTGETDDNPTRPAIRPYPR